LILPDEEHVENQVPENLLAFIFRETAHRIVIIVAESRR
jgi:hypothetical protein